VAFAKSTRLHRGYVVYRGTELRLLHPDVWAIPLAALDQSAAFDQH